MAPVRTGIFTSITPAFANVSSTGISSPTVKGVAADKVEASADSGWALRGDRGLTYADALPEGSTLVEGERWAKDYSGPPLVSLGDEIGRHLAVAAGGHGTDARRHGGSRARGRR